MRYLFVTWIYCVMLGFACGMEPMQQACSKYDYEEKLLERVIRNEISLRDTLHKITETNAKVEESLLRMQAENMKLNAAIQSLEEMKLKMVDKVEAIIASARKNASETVAEMKTTIQSLVEPTVKELNVIKDSLNLALGKPAYQTDTYDIFHASLAVDGNVVQNFYEDSCTHTYSNGNVTWEVDLEEVYVIESVKLYNRLDCCTERLNDVELLIGLSREGFQTRAGFHPGPVGATFTFVLDTPMYGRWVKIANHSPDNVLTLCEVQVEGNLWTPSAFIGFHTYAVFEHYVHTGVAIRTSGNIATKLSCTSLCSNTQNCVSAHYNTATLTCSVFDSLEFRSGGGANDVILVVAYYADAVKPP